MTPTAAVAQAQDGRVLGPAQVRALRLEQATALSGRDQALALAAAERRRAVAFRADFRRVSEILDLPPDTPADVVAGHLERWAEQDDDNRRRLLELGEIVARIDSGEVRDAAEHHLQTAQAAFDDGRFEDADSALAELEQLRRSHQAEARQLWINAVIARSTLADQRRDHASARRLLREFRTEERALSDHVQWRAVMQEAISYQAEDRWNPDNALLVAAIDLLRDDALPLIDRTRNPDDWAETQSALGRGLGTLGVREVGTARLEAAVRAFESALEARSREQNPLDWAEAQFGLGLTLHQLGLRENGVERLEAAARALEAALLEWTRERAPSRWALAQSQLFTVRGDIAFRGNDPALPEGAFSALEAMLEEWPQERSLQFRDQMQALATTLTGLEGDDPAIAEATLTFFEAFFQEFPREQEPLAWAWGQASLGDALAALGEQENDPAHLEAAVAAYEASLLVFTRETFPAPWASIQVKLGDTLKLLGRWRNDPARLEASIRAYEASLLERTRERVPLDWAMTQLELSVIHYEISVIYLESFEIHPEISLMIDLRRMEASAAALENYLLVYTRDRFPLQWALARANLGLTYQNIATSEQNSVRLEMAMEILREARALFIENTSDLDVQLLVNLQIRQIDLSLEAGELMLSIFRDYHTESTE